MLKGRKYISRMDPFSALTINNWPRFSNKEMSQNEQCVRDWFQNTYGTRMNQLKQALKSTRVTSTGEM